MIMNGMALPAFAFRPGLSNPVGSGIAPPDAE